jgi:hypothetical protein
VERLDFNRENTKESAVRAKLWEVFVILLKMNRRGKRTGMVAVVPSVLQVASFV